MSPATNRAYHAVRPGSGSTAKAYAAMRRQRQHPATVPTATSVRVQEQPAEVRRGPRVDVVAQDGLRGQADRVERDLPARAQRGAQDPRQRRKGRERAHQRHGGPRDPAPLQARPATRPGPHAAACRASLSDRHQRPPGDAGTRSKAAARRRSSPPRWHWRSPRSGTRTHGRAYAAGARSTPSQGRRR